MPQEADDQLGGKAERSLCAPASCSEALDNGGIFHAPLHMGLGIEEDLGVRDAVPLGVLEVLPRQGLEIARLDEHRHPDEVVMEEIVERGKVLVPLQERVNRREGSIFLRGQSYVILLGQSEKQRWLQGSFEMHMLLAFWQCLEEGM